MKNAQRLNGRADQTYEVRMFKYMTKDLTLVETDWIVYLEKLPVAKFISKPDNNVQLKKLPSPPEGNL